MCWPHLARGGYTGEIHPSVIAGIAMKITALLLLVPLLAGAADLGPETNGQPVSSATFFGHEFTLPEGNWTQVAFENNFDAKGEIPFKNAILLDTNKKGIKQEWRIRIGHSDHIRRRWLDELCKRNNLYWKESINDGVWKQYCVTVNHVAWQFNWQSGSYYTQRARYLMDKGFVGDRTIIQVSVVGYKNSDYVSVVYEIDPAMYGIKTQYTNWDLSDWNVNNITKFPEKKAFMDRVVAFAERFHPQYYAYLYGKLPDGSPEPGMIKFE